jgi:hypothetical protein
MRTSTPTNDAPRQRARMSHLLRRVRAGAERRLYICLCVCSHARARECSRRWWRRCWTWRRRSFRTPWSWLRHRLHMRPNRDCARSRCATSLYAQALQNLHKIRVREVRQRVVRDHRRRRAVLCFLSATSLPTRSLFDAPCCSAHAPSTPRPAHTRQYLVPTPSPSTSRRSASASASPPSGTTSSGAGPGRCAPRRPGCAGAGSASVCVTKSMPSAKARRAVAVVEARATAAATRAWRKDRVRAGCGAPLSRAIFRP